MTLHITAASHVGCVRENNEDMILAGGHFIRNQQTTFEAEFADDDRYLIAVADGMGGHNCGEVASEDTLRHLAFFFNDMPAHLSPGAFNEAIVQWLDSINLTIDAKGHAQPQYHNMGTTLVGLAFYNGHIYTMNCGDSRLYHFDGKHLTQLTTDHSLNALTGSDKHSNVITNCIGGGCKSSYIDIKQLPGDFSSLRGEDSHVCHPAFLLCSDGLTDMLTDDTICQLLSQGADAQTLTDEAIKAGGLDNISVVVVN